MKAGEPYQLPLSNAHAWTEIYIDGLGWVPIETVAQYREITEQADLSKGLENQTNLILLTRRHSLTIREARLSRRKNRIR